MTCNGNLSAGYLHMLMDHRHSLLATAPKPGERGGAPLESPHQPRGAIGEPDLLNHVALFLGLCQHPQCMSVASSHLVGEHLFDAVLRLDRLGGVEGEIIATGGVGQMDSFHARGHRGDIGISNRIDHAAMIGGIVPGRAQFAASSDDGGTGKGQKLIGRLLIGIRKRAVRQVVEAGLHPLK